MRQTFIIDANVILRLLRKDSILSPKSKKIFDKAVIGETVLYIDELIMAEVVWTLKSYYGENERESVPKLLKILSQDWAVNPRKELIIQALNMYSGSKLSYIDCWLAVLSKNLGLKLETFDRKLKKLI